VTFATAAIGRRLTINTVVRHHQIEATRTNWLWEDERELHSAAVVERFSKAVRDAIPGAQITWAISWGALHDDSERYREVRRALKRACADHGDDVVFVPGGYFANLYGTRDEVARDIADAGKRIADEFGSNPRSLVAGFLSGENIARAADEGITAVQGTIWSQFDIDLQDGDGSIAYPYYPSRRNFIVPGRGDDSVPIPTFDGWTVDLVAARTAGMSGAGDGMQYNSRLGLGPIETLHRLPRAEAFSELDGTSEAHLNDRNVERNGLGWLTVNYEIAEVSRGLQHDPTILGAWSDWLAGLCDRWPDLAVPTLADLGDQWTAAHADNSSINYLLQQEGTGVQASRAGERVTWFMTERFRLGVVDGNTVPAVFDFTSYDVVPAEPNVAGERRWSVLGELNQKRTRPQDEPVEFAVFLASHPEVASELAERYGSAPELAELISRAGASGRGES
jgi:hypothetical protein